LKIWVIQYQQYF